MHYPNLPEFYTTVLGFSVVLIISLIYFIHSLRTGLDSHESVRIDSKENAYK